MKPQHNLLIIANLLFFSFIVSSMEPYLRSCRIYNPVTPYEFTLLLKKTVKATQIIYFI